AWLTDFVGFLPMNDSEERERFLSADYNADMVEHVAHHPDVRDLALFVGNPDDIVPERLGPQLPVIRDWTEQNFDFTGYVTGFAPAHLRARPQPAPPRPTSATAPSCGQSWDTWTMSGSASSPSAGRAWAAICCGGGSPPSRPPRSGSRTCAWWSLQARASTPRLCRRMPD